MKAPTAASKNSWIQILLTIFAVLACLGAIGRMLTEDLAKRIDETTLLYLAVAGGLLLLKDVKTLAFGSYKVEFDRKLEELELKVEDAQAAAVGVRSETGSVKTIGSESDGSKKGQGGIAPVPGEVGDDPWKGVFGTQKTSGTRELDAEVTPIGTPGLFRVRLRVRSTNPGRDPLTGSVQFFLHPTFGNDRPVVTVGPRGVAELALTAWGAFTVGAVADDGRTKLELDLAEIAAAPAGFKAR